jgi:hypothetical protein
MEQTEGNVRFWVTSHQYFSSEAPRLLCGELTLLFWVDALLIHAVPESIYSGLIPG